MTTKRSPNGYLAATSFSRGSGLKSSTSAPFGSSRRFSTPTPRSATVSSKAWVVQVTRSAERYIRRSIRRSTRIANEPSLAAPTATTSSGQRSRRSTTSFARRIFARRIAGSAGKIGGEVTKTTSIPPARQPPYSTAGRKLR